MATSKEYAYYIKGSKLAIVQKDWTFSGGQTISQPGLNDLGSTGALFWKSPKETIADGLEIQYAYSPTYFINETDKVDTQIDTYVSTGGLLKLIDNGDNDYTASPESLGDGSYIVLRKAGKWNGLHKVKEAGVGYITTYTKCSDSATVQQAFEEVPDLYYNVDALNDEADTIDLPEYLTKALVYYVKSQMAEEMRNLEEYVYYRKQFRALIERYQNSRIWGSRKIMAGSHAIR